MSFLTGTNIIAPVIPGATGDSFATHIDIYGQGGYLAVSGINERDYINIDRRSPGMIVYTRNDGKFWSLKTGLSSWVELPLNGFYPRIVSQNIFYTIDDQDLLSGIKSFKNYNDTKFYGNIVSDSGLFYNFSAQGGNITFYSNPYSKQSGKFKDSKIITGTGIDAKGRRPKPEKSGLFNEKENPDDPFGESGILWRIRITPSGIKRDSKDISGKEDISEDNDGDGVEDQDPGDFPVIDSVRSGEEDEDEQFEEETNDAKKGPEDDENNQQKEDGVALDPDGDGGNKPPGEKGGTTRGSGPRTGGGAVAGGDGGGGIVPMIFSSNAPILKMKDHYAKKIRNISVVGKGSTWPTGLNLTWGPNPIYLFPGEEYIASLQILKGTGIFTGNSGIINNNLREFRTSGFYNITSTLKWDLSWNGRIAGYRPDYDVDPWFGSGSTFAYPVSIRYWGTSNKETLTKNEITGLLSGEYAFDPRQIQSSTKTFHPTGEYIYFAWPADSGFNNIDFFKKYAFYKNNKQLNIPDIVLDGYRFIVDKRDVYFEQTLVTGVKNSVNYLEDYYLFRNRWILNGSSPIEVKVKRKDEAILGL